jgi:hypothetical protein
MLFKSETKEYGAFDLRINIYKSKWQYYLFYIVRMALSHLRKAQDTKKGYQSILYSQESNIVFGYSCRNFYLIEVFQLNIERIYKEREIIRAKTVHTIFHELRNRYQNNSELSLDDKELDSRISADNFFNYNHEIISRILNFKYKIKFQDGKPSLS